MIVARAESQTALSSVSSLSLWALGEFCKLSAPTDFKEEKGHGRNPQGAGGVGQRVKGKAAVKSSEVLHCFFII